MPKPSYVICTFCLSSEIILGSDRNAVLHISSSTGWCCKLSSARAIPSLHNSAYSCGFVSRRSSFCLMVRLNRSLYICRTYGSTSSVLKAHPPYLSLTPKKSAWLCFTSGPHTTATLRSGQERQQPTLYVRCYIPSTLHCFFRCCMRSKGRIAPYFVSNYWCPIKN